MNNLRKISVSEIKGVGPKKEQLLNNLNIYSVYDLLKNYPRYYEDFKKIYHFSDISDYEKKYVFFVKITSKPTLKRIRSNLNILTVSVSDGQSDGELVFFNQPFLENYFRLGYKIYTYGKLEKRGYIYQLSSPRILKKDEIGHLEPVYNLTNGLSNNEMKKIVYESFEMYSKDIIDFLPKSFLYKNNFPTLKNALKMIHKPEDEKEFELAKNRLVFDELFLLRYCTNKSNFRENSTGPEIEVDKFLNKIEFFIKDLPFELTNAQKNVINEIFHDLKSHKNLNRLIEGDVGSGKTIVAAIILYLFTLNNYQVAFMAPTEILAVQHFESISIYFKSLDINISILTGSTPQKEKDKIKSDLKSGKIKILIGTHSIIQEDVEFFNLGLTIIDEQHRFGVNQRKALYMKGKSPHNISMTATPIPRTLALALYGDMDVSIIDELPKNRKPIDTFIIDDSYLDRLDNFIIELVHKNSQVFIVCPAIEKSELPITSLEDVYKRYTGKKFKNKNITAGYIHGKMSTEEKNSIMNDFLHNKINILVSTTVIEVGINIPNANLIIVYDADRFGLSQLHQLRGRVGRGDKKSYCVLINNNKSEIAYRRMKIMQQSNDGFYIAKKDLELRGEGELLGIRQHGISELKLANLFLDTDKIEFINIHYDEIVDSINSENSTKNELIKYYEYLNLDEE